MAKDARTEFFYYIGGKPYRLTPGKDGITQEIITVLRDSYHAEKLNDRYEDELQDAKFKFSKTLHDANPIAHPTDPIEHLVDISQAPEEVLFQDELSDCLSARILRGVAGKTGNALFHHRETEFQGEETMVHRLQGPSCH
nr:hypothetical protein [uncultured Sphaerochaeta sp.]